MIELSDIKTYNVVLLKSVLNVEIHFEINCRCFCRCRQLEVTRQTNLEKTNKATTKINE